MTEKKTYTEAEAHHFFGVEFNGQVWGLLGKEDRTQEEAEMMIYSAFASARHWLEAGTGVNHQRGEWMISHAYAELGLAEAALRHGLRCLDLTEQHAEEMEDFDRAYAFEAVARAHAISGNRDQAIKYVALAKEAGQAIADPDSKKYFDGDFGGGDWVGLK